MSMTGKVLHPEGWGRTDNTQMNEIISDTARYWEDDVIESDAIERNWVRLL